MSYSIESIIEQAEQRDHNFTEICRALEELDMPTLERVLVYAVQRREAFNHGDPRTRFANEALPENFIRKATAEDIVREAITLAEKTVRTRKRNAKTRKGNAKTRKIYTKNAATKRPFSAGLLKVAWALPTTVLGSSTAKDIASATKLRLGTVYAHLRALGAHSNWKGGWWIDKNKKDHLASFPIAGKKKKTANGAATSP
jgi:acetyl/propionyl-CoA carboxylase alpha subunit